MPTFEDKESSGCIESRVVMTTQCCAKMTATLAWRDKASISHAHVAKKSNTGYARLRQPVPDWSHVGMDGSSVCTVHRELPCSVLSSASSVDSLKQKKQGRAHSRRKTTHEATPKTCKTANSHIQRINTRLPFGGEVGGVVPSN
jgi:hypothetical protein